MSIVSDTKVPDEGPYEAQIVFIGESPGNTEREEKRPFVGESGKKLEAVLLRNGIERSSIRLANLCHYQPAGNKFENVRDTPYLAEGIKELETYFRSRKTRPNLIVPLGKNPLEHITGITKGGITAWRGSILTSTFPGAEGVKVISSYHPSAVLRDASLYPMLDFDIRRIANDGGFPELRIPDIEYRIITSSKELDKFYDEYSNVPLISVDIETFGDSIACVGFARRPDAGVCVVWEASDFHTQDIVKRLLSAPNIRKIFQFGTFDVNFLKLNDIEVVNFYWDTMVAMHVMYPELPRSLAFMTSIFTRIPFYKFEGRVVLEDDKTWTKKIAREQLWRYNIKDCVSTFIIAQMQIQMMEKGPSNWKRFMDYEMSMLPVAHEIANNGMYMDLGRRAEMQDYVNTRIDNAQAILDQLCLYPLNVSSHPKVTWYLYEILKLPIRKNQEGKATGDEDAIVSLLGFCSGKVSESKMPDTIMEWKRKVAILTLILKIRGYRKLKGSYLDIDISSDNRVRSTYKVAATTTGRWSSEKFIDGSGFNAMTLPRGDV